MLFHARCRAKRFNTAHAEKRLPCTVIAHGSHFLRVILSVLLRCERQGELKLGFAAARADGDLAAVQVDDILGTFNEISIECGN